MTPEALPPLHHRVGGRWLLSTPLILFVCAGTAVAIFAGEPSASASGGAALRWLAVWGVTAAVYAAAALGLRRCCAARFRRGDHLPPWAVVAIVVGAAALIGALHHLGAVLLDLPQRQSLLVGIAVDVPFGLWFGLGFVLLLDELDRAQRARRGLLERRVSVDLGDLQQDLLVRGLREACWRDIGERLSGPRRGLLAELARVDADPAASGSAAVAGHLRALAEGSVRDVGAEMWARAERDFPRLGVRDVVLGVARREPFHPWIMVLIVVVSGLAEAVATSVTAVGIALVVAAAAYVGGVLAAANRLMRLRPARRGSIFAAAMVGAQLYLVPLAMAVDALAPGSAPATWVAVQATAGMITIAVVSAVGSWVHGGRELRRGYLLELDERQLRLLARARTVTAAARDVSRELHGTVQTRLIAAAMAGEQAIASGDEAALRAALDEARRVLEDLGPEPRAVGGIADEVARRAALWEGLCEIGVSVEALETAAADADDVGRVVEEGLANAVRHGGATRIAVSVRGLGDGSVEVVVDDDGSGPAAAAPGLGSAILDAATAGAWTREATADGCRLRARVPSAVAAATP